MERIGGVSRQELLAAVVREGNTAAGAVSIHMNMNVEVHRENFHHQVEQSATLRVLQSHQQGGGLQGFLQCCSRLGPFWASYLSQCLQQEQHNLNTDFLIPPKKKNSSNKLITVSSKKRDRDSRPNTFTIQCGHECVHKQHIQTIILKSVCGKRTWFDELL